MGGGGGRGGECHRSRSGINVPLTDVQRRDASDTPFHEWAKSAYFRSASSIFRIRTG